MKMEWTKEQAYMCARCGYCKPVCPVYRVKGWESSSPRAKLLMSQNNGISRETASRIFECTLCGRCEEACQIDLDANRLFSSLRERHRHVGPEGIDKLEGILRKKRNVLDSDNDERLRWTKRLRDIKIKRENAEVAYFTGCSSALFPALNSIPQSFVKILEDVDEDYFIVGDNEWCCGFPLISLGMPDVAEEFIVKNVETIQSLGAEKVVVTCPGCYKVLKHEYEEVVGDLIDFEVLHSTEYLADMIDRDRISLKKNEMGLTYHDPCDLGRKSGVFEEPRKVIENIPGVSFTELYESGKDCNCCGGGGSLAVVNSELASSINKNKLEEITNTGVENVISACQTCKKNIRETALKEKTKIKVLDIVELVSKSLQ